MHNYFMEIREETENSPSELKLWANGHDGIYLEVGLADNEDAPYYSGSITLTEGDTVALIKELSRLIGYVPTSQIKPEQPTINQRSTEAMKALHTQKSTSDQPAEGKHLTLTQPLPDPPAGQLPSKVNWSK